MNTKQQIGAYGEEVAVRYLKQKGYKILERNFYCKQGEIDIIAKDKNYMIFIEVKTRSNLFYGNPASAINNIKQNHMYRVAKYYLYINNNMNHLVRFDAIEVYVDKNRAKVNHIKQII